YQNKRKGKLRLDDRDNATEKGAVVPGKPDESELVKRLFTASEEDIMPPPESNKKLTPAQKEQFRHWIAEGGQYEPHWAYINPTRPKVPLVGNPTSDIRSMPLSFTPLKRVISNHRAKLTNAHCCVASVST